MIAALIFYMFSLTPSLLPRPWYLQGVASGISVVLGYALGTAVGWLLRRLGFRALEIPRHRRLVNRVLLVAAAVLIPLFGVLGALWQHELRRLSGADLNDPYYYGLVLAMSFTIGRVLLGVTRLLRAVTRRLGRWGARWIPAPVSKLIAVVLVGFLLITIVEDAVLPPIASLANSSFSLTDSSTDPGVTRPLAPQRSGSPASLVSFEDLGREGRAFVSHGPRAPQIGDWTGGPAREPIRIYIGSDSADSFEDQAALALAEMERTDAWSRSVVAVVTTTGRGWINEVAAQALEYMWGGDTAIVAMQYSYLPSPVAFVVDRDTPLEAGRVLFGAVHTAWRAQPADGRPRLLTMGESLGAYGGEGAFDSLTDMVDTVDAAVWVGTPSFTSIWSRLIAARDPGSPAQIPVIDDCAVVCFAASPADLPPDAHPSVVYLQHVNDPIVWWSPDLLVHRPEWLGQAPLAARSPSMTWIPLVTFWQVTADLVFSNGMPDGEGHSYGLEMVDALAATLPPPGWSAADTARLRVALTDVDTGA